jgi:hypothetical protein
MKLLISLMPLLTLIAVVNASPEVNEIVNCVLNNGGGLTPYQTNRLTNYLNGRANDIQNITYNELKSYFDKFTEDQLDLTEYCLLEEEAYLGKLT